MSSRSDPIAYRVTDLPADAPAEDLIRYSITVWDRGQLADLPPGRRWSVDRHDTAQLGRDGRWSYKPPEWDLDWLADHRFERAEAFNRASICAAELARRWEEASP